MFIKKNFYFLFLAACNMCFVNPSFAQDAAAPAENAAQESAAPQAEPVLDEMSEMKKAYARPTEIPYPAENPYTKEKSDLGKMLYFDPRLSKSGTQSCATCHNPSFSWEDGLALGIGHEHKQLGRATPTILNLAWDDLFFWDGRAATLEEQALGPIASSAEMAMDLDQMLVNLYQAEGYLEHFKKAFPDDKGDVITKEKVANAIATFERGIVSANAPFDKWIAGDEAAISEEAKRGFVLFNKKGNCAACHSGWNFSDSSFHDIGLDDPDLGRGKILAQIVPMQHAFKTVGLRNIDRRGPYMHNGSMKTLEDVINHYNDGFVKRDSLSDQIKPLNLTDDEKKDLVAFLHTLTSVDEPMALPELPR